MPKAYDPKAHEDAVYAAWEASGLFNPDKLPGERKEAFSIAMAPPNVTGVLHLGHALEDSLTDAMVRYQRMCGKKTLYIPGTDHAAIPTQAKVEKMLMKEGMKNPRQELGREGLVEKIRTFAEQSRVTILSQVKKMGASCDWSRLAYTFDVSRNAAVNELFRRMYNDGLIYRGYRVVNWSTKGQSTCSDDEIVHVERTSILYTFKYSKDFPIAIASTQPETKLGDTAVAVHPDDVRYQKYIGQTFTVDVGAAAPRNIRVIADEGVDPKFGTGALGVTPAHSAIDFSMYEKQKAKGEPIEIIPVIGTNGCMTEEAGKSYQGLVVEEARGRFVSWLQSEGLMVKEPEEIVQNVGTSDRYGDVIEALPMTQWWLDVNKEIPGRGKTLRDLMREAVTTGLGGDGNQKVTITPERCTKMYLDRVENLRDWCLSRQIWWGHRIPVWYRGEEIFVGNEAPAVEGWEQDPDTLDTWFSSGSWTFSTLGWPEATKELKEFHPTTWITMGYEILYLWLMRMILMSTYALEQIPFKDAYIHGLLRDQHGVKFSKSAGNGIDPIEVIENYGCDALRLSVTSGNTPGNDSRFSMEKVESARNFVNKLWNISRFILTTTTWHHVESVQPKTMADQWILSRYESTVVNVTKLMESYDFSLATEVLREFTWSDFADWYLEMAKVEQGKDEMLSYLLERILKLWHPFLPFVTEVIWKEMGNTEFLMIAPWPKSESGINEGAEKDMKLIQDVITTIRNLRAEYVVEPGKMIDATIVGASAVLEEQAYVIKGLARVGSLTIQTSGEKPEGSAAATVGSTQIYLPLAGLVDLQKESLRLTKELDEVNGYLASLAAKLNNQEFVGKAPAQVVQKMRTNLVEAEARKASITSQLAAIQK